MDHTSELKRLVEYAADLVENQVGQRDRRQDVTCSNEIVHENICVNVP